MNRAILHGVWRQCLKSLAVFLMYLLHSQLAFAAGGCGSASLPFGAVDSVSSSREGQFRIGSVTKYTDFNNFREGADAVTNPGGNRAIITESTLFVDVGLSKRWVVTALVPYIEKKQQTNRFGKRIANGIGDITLLGSYDAISSFSGGGEHSLSAQSLILGLGLKIPTGSIDEPGEKGVSLLPPAFQVGSGAFDLVPTASYYKNVGAIALLGGVVWRIPLEKNRRGYKFGQELELNVGGEYTLRAWDNNVTLMLSASYLYAQHDTDSEFILPARVRNGTKVLNTGGKFVDLVPGMRIRLSHRIGIEATVALPIYENWNGDRARNVGQVAPDWSTQIVLVYYFSKTKKELTRSSTPATIQRGLTRGNLQ